MKKILYMLFGAAVGGAIGYYFGKKSGQKEVCDMTEYDEISSRYRRESKEETSNTDRENGPLPYEKRKEIRDNLGKKIVEPTDYASCYKNDKEEVEVESPATEAIRFHEDNRDRPPEPISESAIESLPGFFDHQLLYFYAFDETVTNEDECFIDEPGHLLGMVLEETGFIEDDTMTLFVVNYQTDCIYEVQKVLASYCETHELIMAED